jgi:hypothetical protein
VCRNVESVLSLHDITARTAVAVALIHQQQCRHVRAHFLAAAGLQLPGARLCLRQARGPLSCFFPSGPTLLLPLPLPALPRRRGLFNSPTDSNPTREEYTTATRLPLLLPPPSPRSPARAAAAAGLVVRWGASRSGAAARAAAAAAAGPPDRSITRARAPGRRRPSRPRRPRRRPRPPPAPAPARRATPRRRRPRRPRRRPRPRAPSRSCRRSGAPSASACSTSTSSAAPPTASAARSSSARAASAPSTAPSSAPPPAPASCSPSSASTSAASRSACYLPSPLSLSLCNSALFVLRFLMPRQSLFCFPFSEDSSGFLITVSRPAIWWNPYRFTE